MCGQSPALTEVTELLLLEFKETLLEDVSSLFTRKQVYFRSFKDERTLDIKSLKKLSSARTNKRI
jgi:hypothetical protein